MVKFKSVINEILVLVEKWEKKFPKLSKEVIAERKNNQNRSIKQIVGHMIDSATNNTHRIIHLQCQESPVNYPDYANLGNNDRWITIQDYQNEDWDNLVQLWKYSNTHLAHVIKNVKENQLGNIWISALKEEVTLQNMIEDYPRHMKLHLSEIVELIYQD